MRIGGLIKSNSISNAYGCCCQFLSRIKPVIKNSKESVLKIQPDSIEFNYHASLIDIYTQIKEGSDDVDIFSFIHISDCESKATIDLISLLYNVLKFLDPGFKFAKDYLTNPISIFYSSLLPKSSFKFQKSFIFDFELIDNNSDLESLTNSIRNQYEYISKTPKVLLFHPTNKCNFNLSFYLKMENLDDEQLIFSLFAFVITKQDKPSHFILYISQNSYVKGEWMCIDDDQISIISHRSLKQLSTSDENNFIIFAFAENTDKSVEFICPELISIPREEMSKYYEDNQNACSEQSITEQQSPTINSNIQFSDISASSNIISSKDIQQSKESSINSSFDDSIIPIYNDKICNFTVKLFSLQKMKFEDYYSDHTNQNFLNAKIKISNILQENSILKAYYTRKSENHKKYHTHLRYDGEIFVYIQKPTEPQILKYYFNSKQIRIKFECEEIKLFNTTALFHTKQSISDLYDFCHILLSNILGIQVDEIKLTLNGRRISKSPKYSIEDIIWSVNNPTVYFSYTEK